ncbi:nucleotide sugar dehydrogenase [Halorussus pelagicus]|uniref:nucleotide sugar dehydrogenase n=1 Tax=Halorussus pelagicus TaxID=2505977 RepID=UPI000FFCB45A|nr:nucleotide sugar dehydrogenase [Halorussus pelagicus]
MTDLRTRLAENRARIGVVGLGYVGLPLSLEFAEAGFSVAGFDIDSERVALLEDGQSYVDDVTDEQLTNALEAGFTPDTDPTVIADCDAYVIAVPTGVSNGEPEMDAVRKATQTIAAQSGDQDTLVVVSSTVYPGATNDMVTPLLHDHRDPDRTYVAMVPERVNPGGDYQIDEIPLIVGAEDEVARRAAGTLFESIVGGTHRVQSATTAELAKTLENTYRMVNIALVNELTAFVERFDADIWDAIEAASTKPFGFQAFYPGPGVGGHCIPIDPQFLTWRASELGAELSLIKNAQRVNEWMPSVVVNRIERIISERNINMSEASIVTLGVSYKPDVGDVRHSPALEISRKLNQEADVIAVDPHVEVTDELAVVPSVADVPLEQADIVALLVDHSDFDLDEISNRASLVFDARNAVPRDNLAEVVTLGDETEARSPTERFDSPVNSASNR